MGFIFR